MSKGSKRRPRQISEQEWFANWERIYGKKKDAKNKKEQEKNS